MKRYGIVLAAVFALVAAAVSLRAQAQDNDPDRWLKIDGWTGTFTAKHQGDFCFGPHLTTENNSVSGSIRFNERILQRNSILWKGTTRAMVSIYQKLESPSRCTEKTVQNLFITKGSGIVTSTGELTINLRTGEYYISFGNTDIEIELDLDPFLYEIGLVEKKPVTMNFHPVTLTGSDKLPVSGLVVSGTYTEDHPYTPYNLSWSLQPDECSADSDIPEVVISKPGKDAELVFRNEPGEIDSKAVAVVASEVPERSLEWTFPEIAGSTLKTKPEDGRGKEVEFFYEGMPEKNSEFGKEREVSVILAPFRECMEPVRHPVRVFFERDGMGNPSGEAPNWFYYWLQTSAGDDQGRVKYGGNGGFCEGQFGWFNNLEDLNNIYICDGVAREKGTNPITGQETEGIDTFAITVIHELQHKTDYENWWGDFDRDNNRPDGSYNPAGTFEHKVVWRDYFNKKKQADRDGDGILDELEEDMGLDPENPDTHNRGYKDSEYSAYEAENAWIIGWADEEDWAVPGKQSGGD